MINELLTGEIFTSMNQLTQCALVWGKCVNDGSVRLMFSEKKFVTYEIAQVSIRV